MKCILCNSDGYELICKKGIYSIVKCNECGFVYTIPLPPLDEIIAKYSKKNAYGNENEPFVPAGGTGRRLRYRLLLKWIEKFSKPGRLLEIGCSQGDLMSAASKNKNWDAMGIDLSSRHLNYTKASGFNVSQGTLEDHRFEDASFDVVVALHVLEHLHDPISTMSEIKRILKPGGVTLIVVPCVSHIKARLAGAKWKYFGPPGHLWYFSPKTFKLLLGKTGFNLRFSSCFYNRAHLKIVAEKPLPI